MFETISPIRKRPKTTKDLRDHRRANVSNLADLDITSSQETNHSQDDDLLDFPTENQVLSWLGPSDVTKFTPSNSLGAILQPEQAFLMSVYHITKNILQDELKYRRQEQIYAVNVFNSLSIKIRSSLEQKFELFCLRKKQNLPDLEKTIWNDENTKPECIEITDAPKKKSTSNTPLKDFKSAWKETDKVKICKGFLQATNTYCK